MKKIKFILFFMFFVTIIFCSKEIYAASAYLSSSDSSLNIGDEFTISISVSDISVATLTARVSVDTSKVQYVSGSSNTNFSNGRAIYSWTDASGGQNPITGGTIATFTFRAIAPRKCIFRNIR